MSGMSHHNTTVVGSGDAWQAKCSCRWRSALGTRAEAVDQQDYHSAQVVRAQAGLGSHTPSLRTVRDYYQRQADNPANTEEERALWQQLSDELRYFIKAPTDVDQLNLWE